MASQNNVQVTVTVSASGQQGTSFGPPCVISTNAAFPERYRVYNGLSEVAEDFAIGSPTYDAALSFFEATPATNKAPSSPASLYVGRRHSDLAWLLTGEYSATRQYIATLEYDEDEEQRTLYGGSIGLLVFDGDFDGSDAITVTVNGDTTGTISFSTTHLAMMQAIVSALNGLDSVLYAALDPSSATNRRIYILAADTETSIVVDVTDFGGTSPTASMGTPSSWFLASAFERMFSDYATVPSDAATAILGSGTPAADDIVSISVNGTEAIGYAGVTLSAALDSGHQFTITVNGTLVAVTYATSASATMDAIVAALNAIDGVTATTPSTTTLRIWCPDGLTISGGAVTGNPTITVTITQETWRVTDETLSELMEILSTVVDSASGVTDVEIDPLDDHRFWFQTSTLCYVTATNSTSGVTFTVGNGVAFGPAPDNDAFVLTCNNRMSVFTSPVETPNEALQALLAVTQVWFSLSFVDIITDDEAVDVSATIQATPNKEFRITSGASNIINGGSTSDIASRLQELERSKTAVYYHPDYPLAVEDNAWVSSVYYGEAALGDRVAARYLPQFPGTYVVKYQIPVGLETYELTASQITTLVSKDANFYTPFGGQWIVSEGKTSAGTWIDLEILSMAVAASVQSAAADLLLGNNKVPYTDAGITTLRNACVAAVRQYENGGIIPGSVTSNFPLRAATTPTERSQRLYNRGSISALLSNGIQTVSLTVNLVE